MDDAARSAQPAGPARRGEGLLAAAATALVLFPMRDQALLLTLSLTLLVYGVALVALHAVTTNDLLALVAPDTGTREFSRR